MLERPSVLNTNETIANKMDFKGTLPTYLVWAVVITCLLGCFWGIACNLSDVMWTKIAGCCFKKEIEKRKELKS